MSPIFVLVGSSLSGGQTTRPATTSQTDQTHYGWDYGLTHRCIHSPHPQSANYYEDRPDCPVAGKAWTIAVQSETTRAGYGPTDQSFPINSAGSPVRLEWVPVADLRHAGASASAPSAAASAAQAGTRGGSARQCVRLTTDFETIAHPGGEGYFTWFVLMDHKAYGGGPLPRPDELLSKVRVTFTDNTPNGATRAFMGFVATWDGQMHGVEVCFAMKNWGDADPAADIVSTIKNKSLEFVVMDGAAMKITTPRGQETPLTFNWHKIVRDLTHRGYFTPPQRGWEQTQTSTVFVGTEVNNFKPTGAARASLSVTDVRVERVSSRPSH